MLYEDGGTDGHRANAYQLRGLILATLGKEAEALEDFDRQIKLQPDRVEPLGMPASAALLHTSCQNPVSAADCGRFSSVAVLPHSSTALRRCCAVSG